MRWYRNSILIYAGLPILSLCALALYYFQNRDKEWTDYLKSSSHREKEILVPQSAVGTVIGRAGANIKTIQEMTNTRINFNDNEEHLEFRTCKVRGTKENIDLAEKYILESISSQKMVKVEEMLVPERSLGRIIGRCGDNIRAIAKITNASINIDRSNSESTDGKKLITIKGSEDDIKRARSLIEGKIQEDELARSRIDALSTRSPRVQRMKQVEPAVDRQFPSYEKLMVSSAHDSMIQVYVSSVDSPSNFWVQLITPRAADLDSLVDEMTEFYNQKVNKELYSVTKPTIGQFLACKVNGDSKWYRSLVTNVKEEDNGQVVVEVHYVDYGDSDYQNAKDLYVLRTDFLTLRFQAIEVVLEASPLDGKVWSQEAIEYFMDITYSGQWKALTAQVVHYIPRENGTQIPLIRLYSTDSSQGTDIAKLLIEAGFAVPYIDPELFEPELAEDEEPPEIDRDEAYIVPEDEKECPVPFQKDNIVTPPMKDSEKMIVSEKSVAEQLTNKELVT